MKTQIAVRLDSEAVDFLDATVASGNAMSRAELIGRLIDREVRRVRALADIEIMKRAGVNGYPDFAAMHEVAARRSLDLD